MIDSRRMRYLVSGLVLTVVALSSLGCVRGRPSDDPPIHLNPNMDRQQKYLPQAQSEFFVDGMTMRKPVAGTVARGELNEDNAYYRGRDERDSLIAKIPVAVTMQLLQRGQERFNIYCSPCHGKIGDGKGIVVQRGMLPPPSFHDERILKVPDGHIFDVISNGIRNMPTYRHQIPVPDRWAIVAYLRALQRSQNATLNDIPAEMRGSVH